MGLCNSKYLTIVSKMGEGVDIYSIEFYFNIYLLIWLHQVLVAAGGLLSCSSPAPYLWHANSWLRHACGI